MQESAARARTADFSRRLLHPGYPAFHPILRNMRFSSIIPVAAVLCALSHCSKCHADAEIYSWTDKNGTPVYSNRPPIPPEAVKFYPPVVFLQASNSGQRTPKQDKRLSTAISTGANAGGPETETASEPEPRPEDAPQDH